ncbi:MAG: allantoinase AllB [Myxococcota bacterium]|nr:allantoinase AllB [Myxococcota bacterium]
MSQFLQSRCVLTPQGSVDGAVEIADGKVVRVLSRSELPAGAQVEDLGDLVLMPGLVDSHAHINEPGRTDWEGFETATRAAAAGGITTVVDMPLNSIPVTTTPDALRQKVAATEGKIRIDCAFWGGLIPQNAGQLEALVQAGVVGAKAFLVHSGIDEFPMASEDDLRRGMIALAHAGAPLIAHAELDRHLPGPEAQGDKRSYRTYLASRPPQWEVEAVAMLARLARETGCATHIVHLSAADALEEVRRARAEGLAFSAETCPHYLTLCAEEIPDGRTEFKCAPPIRERANQARLWEALGEGTISMVVSDHSPCTPQLKLPEAGDFLGAWGGIASLELGLSNLWTHAQARGFTLLDVSRWMSANPARLTGLSSKGTLEAGKDADLIAFDPDAEREIRLDTLNQRHRITPYAGRRVRGVVRRTYLRGEKIYEDGRFIGAPVGRPILGRNP